MANKSDPDSHLLTQRVISVDEEAAALGPTKQAVTAKAKRGLLLRLFGIGPWGAVKLVILCIVVGFFVMAASFDAADPQVNVTKAIGDLVRNVWEGLGFTVRNFWKPALAGAGLVLPLWILWRLVTLPFRR